MSDMEILTRRARALATARLAHTNAREEAETVRYLLAHCGSERVAVRLTSVAEVYRPAGVTPLPEASPPLWGLTSWRGRIIPALVIGECIPSAGEGLVAVLADGEAVFGGVWLSQVEGEIEMPDSEVHDAEVSGGREAFLTGVTRDAVLVLDATQLKAVLERSVPLEKSGAEQNSTRSRG